jgi:hypothetical protein
MYPLFNALRISMSNITMYLLTSPNDYVYNPAMYPLTTMCMRTKV